MLCIPSYHLLVQSQHRDNKNVFIVDFEHISHFFLVFLLLALIK